MCDATTSCSLRPSEPSRSLANARRRDDDNNDAPTRCCSAKMMKTNGTRARGEVNLLCQCMLLSVVVCRHDGDGLRAPREANSVRAGLRAEATQHTECLYGRKHRADVLIYYLFVVGAQLRNCALTNGSSDARDVVVVGVDVAVRRPNTRGRGRKKSNCCRWRRPPLVACVARSLVCDCLLRALAAAPRCNASVDSLPFTQSLTFGVV